MSANSPKFVQNLVDIYNYEEKVYTFDNSKFYQADAPWFSWFTSPFVPVVSIILYLLVTKPFFAWLRTKFNIQPKGPGLQALTIIHSAALAIYSGWTAYNSIPLVYNFIQANGGGITGFTTAMCDVNGDLWFGKDLSFWSTHFYISKLYEFIDTFIVILKGRDPIFLQTFHHAGILILMWALVVASSSVSFVIVCLNSFIHTLMYTYYVLAAFGLRSPLKSYLTQAQIIQFIVGISMTLPYLLMPGCLTPFERISLGSLQIYTFILIGLFAQFYISSYTKASKAKKEKSKKAA
jgi:hypothetical protein